MVVAAHSDDETLGCGATLHRHSEAGDRVVGIHLTNGIGARETADAGATRVRTAAAEEAAQILGFEWIAAGNFPDNQMDGVELLKVVKFVEQAKRKCEPDLVYTHHGGDLNVDHRIAFQATLTAFRPQPSEKRVEIRSFEVPSSTEWSHRTIGDEFRPNLYVDVSEHWEQKARGLEAYAEEMRPAPHSRSVRGLEALATRRGAEAGVDKAEAFELVRRIVRG